MKTDVHFYQGYAGVPKAQVTIGEKTYVLETHYLAELLGNMIDEKGYKIEQSKRQKYPRLVINS